MLLGGDECGRSQHGNNNAYCQDNETSWLDWTQATEAEGAALTAFVERIIALRHRHAVLRAPRFLHGQDKLAPGIVTSPGSRPPANRSATIRGTIPRSGALVLRRAGATAITRYRS